MRPGKCDAAVRASKAAGNMRGQVRAVRPYRKHILICSLLGLALLLSACAAKDKRQLSAGWDGQMNYTASKLQLPEELGSPVASALGEGAVYVLGSREEVSRLFSYDTAENQWRQMDAASYELYTACGMAVAQNSAFVFSTRDRDSLDYLMTVFDLKSGKAVEQYALAELGGELIDCWAATQQGIICKSSFGAVYTFSHTGAGFSKLELGASALAVAVVDERLLIYVRDKKACSLLEVDLASGAAEKIYTTDILPDVSYSGSAGLIFANATSVYRFDEKDGRLENMFNWLDIGIDAVAGVGSLNISQSGEMYLVDKYAHAVYRVWPGGQGERKPLVIGCGQGTYGPYLTKAVAVFNAGSDDYVARIETYSLEEAEQLTAAIAAGSGPDILFMGSSTLQDNPFNNITVDSGVFSDLLPYLDADREISRADFVPNVLAAMCEGGKMLSLIPYFSLDVIAAPESLETDTWTVADLLDINAGLPEGYCLFNYIDRDGLLDIICRLSSLEYIDFAAGECYFDDASFARWLELCRDAGYYGRGRQEGFALYAASISSENTVVSYREALGGCKYMGYPGKGEDISFFSSLSGGFSLLESSQNKDAGWEFLRVLLSPEIQDISLSGFPVISASLERRLYESRQSEYIQFSQEDSEKLEAAIAQAESFARGSAVSAIIKEEAQKFFAGQKTIADTVLAIQSRAEIYLAEQG